MYKHRGGSRGPTHLISLPFASSIEQIAHTIHVHVYVDVDYMRKRNFILIYVRT